jgi:CRP-like cAMP-binding protein
MSDDAITLDRIRRMLAAHPFTKGLTEDEIESLAELARLEEFDAGGTIFEAASDAETFYLIRSGLVALEVETSGVVNRTIQQIAEGTALGWSWLFPPYQWQFSAVARSPVRTIAFDSAALRAHFEANPTCGYHVLAKVAEVMADRLHATRRQVVNLVG